LTLFEVVIAFTFVNKYNSTLEKAIETIDGSSDKLAELARFIHSHPELCFRERRSSAAVIKLLEEAGFEVESGVAGLETAFVGRAPNSGPGPRTAFLAEYDALAGMGHACGHNLIAAAAAGAAIGVAGAYDRIPGEILCMGTPAEEGGAGKVLMANEGVFDGLDAVMLAHPSNRNMVIKKALGVVAVKVSFFGKSAHASAWPERGINALDAMIQFFNGINAMRQQFPKHVRVHGVITDGGKAPNVIPDHTEAGMLVRALEESVLEDMLRRVELVAKGAAVATGCEVTFESQSALAYAPFHPNRVLGGIFRSHLEALGVDVYDGPEDEGMGSSDIGNVGGVAPTIHPEFAVCEPEVGNHTPEFEKAAGSERGIEAAIVMAKAMAMTAISIIEEPELLKKIRAEFDSGRSGRN